MACLAALEQRKKIFKILILAFDLIMQSLIHILFIALFFPFLAYYDMMKMEKLGAFEVPDRHYSWGVDLFYNGS